MRVEKRAPTIYHAPGPWARTRMQMVTIRLFCPAGSTLRGILEEQSVIRERGDLLTPS